MNRPLHIQQGEGPCNFKIASYAVGYYCVIDPDAKFPNVPGLSDYANTTVTKLITGKGRGKEQGEGERGSAQPTSPPTHCRVITWF